MPVKFAFATSLVEFELIEKGTLKSAAIPTDINHKLFQIVSNFFETLHLKLPKPAHCKHIRDVQTDITVEAATTFGDGEFATNVKFVLYKLLPVVYSKQEIRNLFLLVTCTIRLLSYLIPP